MPCSTLSHRIHRLLSRHAKFGIVLDEMFATNWLCSTRKLMGKIHLNLSFGASEGFKSSKLYSLKAMYFFVYMSTVSVVKTTYFFEKENNDSMSAHESGERQTDRQNTVVTSNLP